MLDIVVHYDNNPFCISADTNKDDLECPIQVKVRFTDGTLGAGFTAYRRRRTGVKLLKLVIFHLI